eukprot:2249778-Amphidinium_carterae.1
MGSDGCTLRLHLDLSVRGISRRLLECDILFPGLRHLRVLVAIIKTIVKDGSDVLHTFWQTPILVLLGDLLGEFLTEDVRTFVASSPEREFQFCCSR